MLIHIKVQATTVVAIGTSRTRSMFDAMDLYFCMRLIQESVTPNTDKLTLFANLGWLDTAYKDIKVGAQIKSTTEFGGAPDKSYNLTAQYDWGFDGGANLMTRLTANYVGLFWRSPIPSYREDAYGGNTRSGDIWRWNGRMVYSPGEGNYEIAAYVNNITNEYYINSGFMDSIWQFDFSGVDAPNIV